MSMSDNDLDDLLRGAMKSLDAEVPSGYFEALPDKALARLDEGSMQQQGTQGTTENQVSAPPPVGENTEDSGLHDIRNLAQSTKQRLSSKRITTSPPVSDSDVVASTSAGWKAVALPQPAKMVALPELAELPSKKEVIAREKAAAKAAKAEAPEKKSEKKIEAKVAAAAVEAPAAEPVVPAKKAFSLPSQQKKSKGGLYAVIGIGLAAAAGAAIFVATQKKDASPSVAQNAAAPTTATAQPTVTPIAAGSAAVSADVQKAQDEIAKQEAEAERMKAELAAAQAAAPADKVEGKADTGKVAPTKTKGHGVGGTKVETTTTKPVETKSTPDKGKDIKKPDGATKTGDEGEPDFNDLLKQAGVKDQAPKKPVLDKKKLTGDDFKAGMAAITPAAKNCYKGTQGTATVKLVIAPTGKISKVTVGGQFAGTPEGECVANAVKGASFPAWDGGPESFSYPILLSE
jgi:hypothetical protein